MRGRFLAASAALAIAVIAASCASNRSAHGPGVGIGGETESGIASVYHHSLAGRPTANGERYDPNALTCAHRTLPLGTMVEVRAVRTGGSAVCRVNDRGPYAKGRLIDLSEEMALRIGMDPKGIAKVELRVVR
jgi:rare lipoprotein A